MGVKLNYSLNIFLAQLRKTCKGLIAISGLPLSKMLQVRQPSANAYTHDNGVRLLQAIQGQNVIKIWIKFTEVVNVNGLEILQITETWTILYVSKTIKKSLRSSFL